MKIIINAAVSIDGRIATRTKESKISSFNDLQRLHKLRNNVDAVLVGIRTVLNDDPLLNVRYSNQNKKDIKNPYRIIVDSRARIPLESRIIKTSNKIQTIIIVTKDAPQEKIDKLIQHKVKIITSGGKGQKVNLKKTFHILETEFDIHKILVEGGGEINWSIIKNKLLDEIIITISPVIIGGKEAISLVEGKGFGKISRSLKLKLVKVVRNKYTDEIEIYYKNIAKKATIK